MKTARNAAAGFISRARSYLHAARCHVDRAQTAKRLNNPTGARYHVRMAQWSMLQARMQWAAVRRAVATAGAAMSGHYARTGSRWRAVVSLAGEPGAWLYRGADTYAQRQSAQRAAHRLAQRLAV